MSIDKAISHGQEQLEIFGGEHKEFIETAIETMRKYQKIREIAFPLQFCSTDKLEHEAIMKICEVLEDGNNDR